MAMHRTARTHLCVLFAALTSMMCTLASTASALEAVYLVRHAEKEVGWPRGDGLDRLHPLSAKGIARAGALASRMHDVDLVAIAVSPTTRSIHTALPTATSHDLTIEVESSTTDRARAAAWLEQTIAAHPGPGALLIVGHSNTIPWWLEFLGADATCHERLGITEASYGPATEFYDGLWKIRLDAGGCEAIELHRFGR